MTLDIPVFRAMFKMFSDETAYPDALLNMWYPIGMCYIADNDCTAPEECRAVMYNLMLAHLLYINDQVNSGNIAKVITSASEGAVSVSLAEPPSSSNWEYWLNTSPYGPRILAMLEGLSAGGFMVGGFPERSGFRKIGGLF